MKFAFFKSTLMLATIITLTACGGGSSNSSGGGNTVVYIGTQTLTLSAGGITETAEPSRLLIRITGDNVMVDDVDFKAFGKMNGAQFSVTSPVFNFSSDGITCTNAKITYAGSRSSNQKEVSGKVSGTFSCQGLSFIVGGGFSANSGPARQLNKTLSDVLIEAIH